MILIDSAPNIFSFAIKIHSDHSADMCDYDSITKDISCLNNCTLSGKRQTGLRVDSCTCVIVVELNEKARTAQLIASST